MRQGKKRSGMAAVLALSMAAFASCGAMEGFLPVHRLRVRFPKMPDTWNCLPDLRMALSWRDADGRNRSLSCAPGSSTEIEVERGRPQIIVAVASSKGRGLKPAGALYPEALACSTCPISTSASSEDEIVLDWIGGYVASVACALEREGLDPRAYALERLEREIMKRSSDPWVISAEEIARRLYEKTLRSSIFNEPRRYSVLLPPPGPWAPESPCAAAPRLSAKEGVVGWETDVPAGLWRFVGPDSELILELDSEGTGLWVFR
jgi:hypothetical protein